MAVTLRTRESTGEKMTKENNIPAGGESIRHLRQLSIVHPNQLPKTIVMIGVGGIGSNTLKRFEKMGCPKIELWDPDVVKEHNLGSQDFEKDTVGMLKVEAAQRDVDRYADSMEVLHPEKFNGDVPPESVVIISVDSMEARSQVWHDYIKLNPNVLLYIDARMAAEYGYVYSLPPCDDRYIDAYEKTLHSDAEAEDLPCTAKGIDYNTVGISARVARVVKGFAKEERVPFKILDDQYNYTTQKWYIEDVK